MAAPHDPSSPVVLVIGDPFVPAATIAAPLYGLAPDWTVVEHDWDVPFDQAVDVNRQVERDGPEAGAVELTSAEDPARVIGVVTQFHPLPARTLTRWPQLRFVATLRAGTENVDVEELRRRGVPLVDNAGRNANAVAEFTVGAILGQLRRLGEHHHSIRTGGWRAPEPDGGYQELAGMTVGLVGFGAIGSLVATKLGGFDVRLLASDPFADLAGRGDVEGVDLSTLLRDSDVVSLHTRLTPDTQHLLGAAELDLLRPHAVLVNTARAELVDEDALVARLRDGRIGGAALDVFGTEPLPRDHPLRSLPQVALSPHLAGATAQARDRAPQLLARRIADRLGLPAPGA